jgi:formylglycine-generating enzyme required for sulfatase activity
MWKLIVLSASMALAVGAAAGAESLPPPRTTEVTVAMHAAGPPPAQRFVRVEGGAYRMGGLPGSRDLDESSLRTVTVSTFYMGVHEVTQGAWVWVMGYNPSRFVGKDRPVENVSWLDAVDYCNRLSDREGRQPCYAADAGDESSVRCDFTLDGYRLPTEAEWEYAAQGGRGARAHRYAGSDNPVVVGWFDANSGGSTHPVAQKRANELGLYDMTGNVWEWCWDRFGWYAGGSRTDPLGPTVGSARILRGGSWRSDVWLLRVSEHLEYLPGARGSLLGFRVVRRGP